MVSPSQINENMCFKKNPIESSTGEYSLDGNMMRVFFAMDENKTAGQVAEEAGFTFPQVQSILSKLASLNLITAINMASDDTAGSSAKPSVLGSDFFKLLTKSIILAVGPMGEFLVEDGLDEIGFTEDSMPFDQAAGLIRILTEDISDQDAKQKFLSTMAEYLK